MADYNSGNFINPDYATPEQIKQLREQAEMLQRGAIAPTSNSWAGVLAQGLMGLRGGMGMSNANQLQRQLLQQQANAIQGAGMNNPAAGVVTGQNPMQPQASAPPASGGNNALKAAILMQESGNRDNVGTSSAGAMGPGQIMPNTFASVAKPGENINNPLDNRNVSGRLMDGYMAKYGDPARAAVAYYSGEGNVAPPGSQTPWIRDISKDKAGNPIKPVSSYVSDVMGRVGGGGQPQMAQNNALSTFYTTPGVDPALKQRIMDLNTPTPATDVYGRPGVRQGVMGQTNGLPVQGQFQPGVMVPSSVNAGGANVSTSVPLTAPNSGQPQNLQGQMQPLMDVAKTMGPQGAALGAENEQTKQAVDQAYQTIPIRQTLMTMKDDILSHGDKMVWGPTSDWITNLKRGLAQHAPGFFKKEDLDALASSDSFEKLSAQLQTMVGRAVGPTDASLFQGMKSVPGSHNSKEGALALIDMLDQQARQNGEFMIQNRGKIGTPGFDLLAERNRFFEQNPIINPITKNPIRMDLTGKAGAGETKTIGNKSYQKLNGIWHEVM